jgi:hypothetical protein
MKSDTSFWKSSHLSALLGSLKQATGVYSSGLFVLAALAVVALVMLPAVQPDWDGVWIAKHGRVHAQPATVPVPVSEPMTS